MSHHGCKQQKGATLKNSNCLRTKFLKVLVSWFEYWFPGNRLLFIDLYAVTYQELFVRLVPYHCLGSLWSQRDKKGREGVCWSVRATIRQFNKLANAVLASCLWPTKLRSQQRARLLEKWISVAEVSMQKSKVSALKMQDFMPFLQTRSEKMLLLLKWHC